ncbi:iron ABC transporter permease [Sansalvadorimonas sp. 2012CJ34-2]|uniref:Iron ABC transporter permease n=1 Tax=Parendozoicomonas callyspongiae TaxID=2942213 RepID=A0ABT0PB28_9GAMM|nr:iron ABC transporter permease [Sansalvadorimonas sp. 2012CJ34-2]MCL6268593.1 iron ABC transporter permease [Sansalvadorimonas sp. 2012CJ34-2]
MKHNLPYAWRVGSWLLALLLFLPVIALIVEAFAPSGDIFNHLWRTVLGNYIANSALLVAGVGVLGTVLSVPAAWIMARTDIPGRKVLQWLLILPLAMPAYVIAYIYTDLLEFSGPIQGLLRHVMGWESAADYSFPEIRSLPGAVIVLSLVLYPYQYLLVRTAFLEQSQTQAMASRLLGCTPLQSFLRVAIPMARPAIITGLALMGMETLADFATVSYFAVPTMTTAVYDTWLGYGSLSAAARLSALMLLAVVLLISMEKYSRRRQSLFQRDSGYDKALLIKLSGSKKFLALIWCWMLVVFGFVLPAFMLLKYLLSFYKVSSISDLLVDGTNSLIVAGSTALAAAAAAILFGFYQRFQPGMVSRIPGRLISTGYALPGTVLAIAVLIPLSLADTGINELLIALGQKPVGLVFSGSIFAVVLAMVIRFSAIAVGSVEASLERISPSLDMASRTLGCTIPGMVRRVHLPLMRKGILTGLLLVFVEAMKELPAVLLLRPFNFETLATSVFQYVSDEKLEYAAPAAIALVVAGLVPLIVMNWSMDNSMGSNSPEPSPQQTKQQEAGHFECA